MNANKALQLIFAFCGLLLIGIALLFLPIAAMETHFKEYGAWAWIVFVGGAFLAGVLTVREAVKDWY
jgi:hypothetical protein